MNTKGMKFLATLAVLAMAFAAIAVVMPAASSDAVSDTSVKIWDEAQGKYVMGINETKISAADDEFEGYYYTENTTVKVKDASADIKIYVKSGVTVELKVTGSGSGKITLATVCGDRAEKTVKTDSTISFTAAPGIYEYVGAKLKATTGGFADGAYASFYSSETLAGFTAGAKTGVQNGTMITVANDATVDNKFVYGISYGLVTAETNPQNITVYTAAGMKANNLTLAAAATTTMPASVTIHSGTVKVSDGDNTVSFTGITDANMEVAYGNGTNTNVTFTETGYTGSIVLRTGTASTITTTGDNNTTLEITKGSTIISTAITNNGTLIIKNSYGITSDGTSTGTAAITNAGVIKAQNKELWYAVDENVSEHEDQMSIYGLLSSTGLVDTSAISEPLTITSGTFATMTVNENQILNLTGDAQVRGVLTVYGVVNISTGVNFSVETVKTSTLVTESKVIESGPFAMINNNGTISVNVNDIDATGDYANYTAISVSNYATFNNNGTINTTSKAPAAAATQGTTLSIDSALFVNKGTINVTKNDIVTFGTAAGSAPSNAGTMVMAGTFAGYLKNSGELSIRSAVASNSAEIVMTSSGATLDLRQITIPKASTLTISSGVYTDDDATYDEKIVFSGDNEVITEDGATYTIKGFAAGVKIFENEASKESVAFLVSGTIGISTTQTALRTGDEAYVLVETTGYMIVDDTLVIPARMSVSANASGSHFIVNGSLTAAKTKNDVTFSTTYFDVYGRASGEGIDSEISNGRFARYALTTSSGDETNVYTTLKEAISEATLVGIYSIEVSSLTKTTAAGDTNYPYVIDEDLVVPAEMDIDATGKYLKVTSSVTVSEGAMMTYTQMIVTGDLTAVDRSSLSGDTYSDILIKNQDSMYYMNFATAATIGGSMILNGAPTATYANGVTSVTKDVTIPAGVTVNLTATEDEVSKPVLQFKGCNLTVDGTLIMPDYAGSFVMIDGANADASFDLDGTFMTTDDVTKKWWYPSGIHYTAEIDDKEYDVSTSIANISAAIQSAVDKEIILTADENVGSFTVAGTADEPVKLTVKSDLEAGTITLSYADLILEKDNSVTATIADTSGSIVIENARVVDKLEFEERGTLTMTGGLTDLEDEDNDYAYSVVFLGETAIESFTAYETGSYTDTTVEGPSIVVTGTLNVKNKNSEFVPEVDIYGSVIAGSMASVDFDVVNVYGSLVAVEKTGSAMAGNVEAQIIFIGTDKYTVYSKPILETIIETSAQPSVSGNVSLAEGGYIYAAANAEVDDQIVEDLNSLELQMDGETYLRIYSAETTVLAYGLLLPSIESEVKKFVDENGEEITSMKLVDLLDETSTMTVTFGIYDEIASGIYGFSLKDQAFFGRVLTYDDQDDLEAEYLATLPLSKEGKVVNAVMDYEVYTVVIKTDDGVKSVSLNGMVMVSGQTNEFVLRGIIADTYKVTYTLKSGYEGTPVLYTEAGTIMKDYAINVTGDFDENIVYQLLGTEKEQPEPTPTPEEKSEWTVTTILLCVLVVLIAIMAVIVALRLNRN